MTPEKFKSLKVGDLVEARSMFPKITDEATQLKVSSIQDGQARFLATWMGVTLGVFAAEIVKGKVEWSFQ